MRHVHRRPRSVDVRALRRAQWRLQQRYLRSLRQREIRRTHPEKEEAHTLIKYWMTGCRVT